MNGRIPFRHPLRKGVEEGHGGLRNPDPICAQILGMQFESSRFEASGGFLAPKFMKNVGGTVPDRVPASEHCMRGFRDVRLKGMKFVSDSYSDQRNISFWFQDREQSKGLQQLAHLL